MNRLAFGQDARAFMALELVPRSLDGVEGMVIYPPEFARFV
ncbi:MAG: hypothetical protein WBZ29_17035 [Methanocella sp.]